MGDDVDTLWMSQDMSPSLGVVHQCLDTPYNGCVYTAFWGLIVHAFQEVQQTAQTIQLNESHHKPEKIHREKNKTKLKVKKICLFKRYSTLWSQRMQKPGLNIWKLSCDLKRKKEKKKRNQRFSHSFSVTINCNDSGVKSPHFEPTMYV